MPKYDLCIVYSTFPNKRITKKIARILIREKLIACINIFKIDSVYIWKGKIEDEGEYCAFMKTRKSLYTKVEKMILSLHPYECAEIIQIPINIGYAHYLEWIKSETK